MKLASVLSLVAAATLVSAGVFTSSEPRFEKDIVPGAFIVEFQDGFNYEKSGIFLNIKAGLSFDIRNQFDVFNGMSIKVKSDHTGLDLAKMDGIKRVWPVTVFRVPKQPSSSSSSSNTRSFHPTLTNAHQMTGVNYIQETFKYTGKGIKVGVVDTGIDYLHPAFGGCTGLGQGAGCRVITGWDLIGEKYDDGGVIEPDNDPMDCDGHGTHVAGIIGADARNTATPPFVGVAPEVSLGAYKVLSCKGDGPDDVIMKGMERAAKDGMNIINLSLGDVPSFRSHPMAVLGDNLAAQGVSIIGAAGNSGDEGVWSVEAAGLGALATSVAAFDNIGGFHYYFTYQGVEYPYIFSSGWGGYISYPSPVAFFPVLKSDGSLSNGCTADSYPKNDVNGKVVLIISDTKACDSAVSGAAAKAAGAVGVLVQSVPYGLEFIDGNHDIAMGSIEGRTGRALIAAYKSDPSATFQWSTVKKSFNIEGGGTLSEFSTWGLDGELHIKPDIAAPGGNILSTYPRNKGNYTILSGTSMATPYIAGAHALLFNANNNQPLRPQDARQILMNTAIPGRIFEHNKIAPVAKQGSGLVNIKNAITAKTLFSPDRIELLDTVHFTGQSIQVTIKNVGDTQTDYVLSHEPAESAVSYRGGNKFPLGPPIMENDEAVVTFSSSKVTVAAGQSTNITVQFQEPSTGQASEFPFYSGYIVATPQAQDGISVRIPYAGVKGDVAKLPIMDTQSGYPQFKIFNRNVGQNVTVEKGYKINWETDQPYIYTRLGSFTPELSGTRRLAGYLDTPSGIAAFPSNRNRNLDDDKKMAFTAVAWRGGNIFVNRGDATPTKAPPGEYQVIVVAQRKLSQGNFPIDHEVYEVADINI